MLIGGNTIYTGTENAQVDVGAVHRTASVWGVVIRRAIESIALTIAGQFRRAPNPRWVVVSE
jgi:hypothetical protein